MVKISNTSAYPNLATPVATDYLILTDQSDNLLTKSCTLGDVQKLFGVDTLIAKVTVSSAALLTLSGNPVTLINAPGAGKVIDTMRKHFLGLIIKDHDAWLKAYIAAAKDPDPKVRRWVAQNVGGTYVWNAKEVNSLAVDLLLELAHDKDRQVRYDASYYGLNRLPKGHPAQPSVDKINQTNRDRRIEKMRQALLKAIKDGKFQMVEKFLRNIKPRKRTSYRKGEREKVQALYNEISKKLFEARQLSKNIQPLAK